MGDESTPIRTARRPSVLATRTQSASPPWNTAWDLDPHRVDVAKLLCAYRAALTLIRDPPSSISLPEHAHRARRLHCMLRPTWGKQLWTVRHIRRHLESLERGFARRLAVNDADDNDPRDREAICQFRESLPPPASRLLTLGLFVAAVVLAQEALQRLPGLGQALGVKDFNKALDGIGPTPSVTSIGDLVNATLHASVGELLVFVAAVCWSAYVVTRALATGYRLAGLALRRPDGLGIPRRHADLVAKARTLEIREKEDKLLARLEMPRPKEIPFDLAVKAALCAPLIMVDGAGLRASLAEGLAGIAVVVIGPLTLVLLARFVVLGLASHKRGSGILWLVLPVALLALACVVPALYPPEPPRTSSPQLRLTLSMARDLSGIDLRGRNLNESYLYAKNLARAQLSHASLVDADLTRAKLVGAHLQRTNLFGAHLARADLRHADLAGADLGKANLESADLARAKLVGAHLQRTHLLGAHLDRADLRHADLAGADLNLATLRGADVRGTDLRGATLLTADLARAKLVGAHLQRTNLLGAYLDRADLRHAELAGADLGFASLRGADVRGTDLREANLQGAHLDGIISDRRTRWPASARRTR